MILDIYCQFLGFTQSYNSFYPYLWLIWTESLSPPNLSSMWKWMGLFFRKNHILRCWHWLSLLNWKLLCYLLRELPPKKSEHWFFFCQFFFFSTTWTCIEYCCYVRGVTLISFFELLDKVKKWMCRSVGPCDLLPLLKPWLIVKM